MREGRKLAGNGRKQLFASLAIAAGFLTVGWAATEARAQAAKAPKEIRILLCGSSEAPDFSSIVAAHGTGKFKELEAKFQTKFQYINVNSGAECAAAFARGDVDILGNSFRAAAAFILGKQDVKIFFVGAQGSQSYFVGGKANEATRGTDLKKWDGANIAATSGLNTAWIQRVSDHYGIKINQIVMPSYDAILPVVRSGRVDGFVGPVTFVLKALLDGDGFVVLDLTGPDGATVSGGRGEAGTSLMTTNVFAQKYPEFLQAFVDVNLAMLLDIKAKIDDPAALAKMMEPSLTTLPKDEALWRLHVKLMKNRIVRADGGISQQQFDSIMSLFREGNNIAKDAVVPGKLHDMTYVLQAYKNLGVAAPGGIPATFTDAKP